MFYQDPRPRQAAAAFGSEGRLDGMSILELGPLEGAHTYQLEQLGAQRVVAIESNGDAFQRCLVVKNMLALNRTTFLLGDCTRHLAASTDTYDMIFASGILYHMDDPAELIRLLAARTSKVFIWTHYYDAAFRYANGRPLPHKAVSYSKDGLALSFYRLDYGSRFRRDFLGGLLPQTHWLSLEGIFAALAFHGFATVRVIDDNRNGQRGPAVTLAASR